MKTSISAFFLLGAIEAVFGSVVDEHAYDGDLVERLLGNKMQRQERELTGYHVPKQMYTELIYQEQACRRFLITDVTGNIRNEVPAGADPIQVTEFAIGDYGSFQCDLYEEALNFGQFGGNKVGSTLWGCKVIAFVSLRPDADPLATFTEPVWDCTVTDYIGLKEGDDLDFTDEDLEYDYIRNEGVMLFLFDPNIRDTSQWNIFHSHEGVFATTGGAGTAVGARGQMEVIFDDFSISWFHVYTVEVWNLEQNNPIENFPPSSP
uniref:TLDc domain-containing protein n=1 Tax=Ditylum brightwellii TaxID=49249 RepID=A0A7S4VIL7_9STRA